MSAELVGILSVGATLLVGGLATAGALVGLIFRLDARQSARMDRLDDRMDRLSARMDRLSVRMDRLTGRMDRLTGRMDTLEARQYEIAQAVSRLDATQQTMLVTLARIEEHTRPAGDPPARPTALETGAEPTDRPRQSVTASTPTSA